MTQDQQLVLDFVKRDPGCTARDVAREVFKGNGDTRTSERTKAHKCIAELYELGHIRFELVDSGPHAARRWHPR
jgi:hypothetical protein